MKIGKKIIELIRQGDPRTIEEVYTSYYKLVKFKVFEIVHNNEDADEVTQNVFVKVFGRIDQYDPDMNFGTWIIRVAQTTAIDYLRPKQAQIEYRSDISEWAGSEDKSAGGELDVKIKELLTEEEYNIVTYKIYFDLKFTDIAQMLDLNLPIVTGKYYRAIRKLKKSLKEEDFYD